MAGGALCIEECRALDDRALVAEADDGVATRGGCAPCAPIGRSAPQYSRLDRGGRADRAGRREVAQLFVSVHRGVHDGVTPLEHAGLAGAVTNGCQLTPHWRAERGGSAGADLLDGHDGASLSVDPDERVVEAEAAVPMAIAEAFRNGKLGVMEYAKYENVIADTKMRDSIGEEGTSESEES